MQTPSPAPMKFGNSAQDSQFSRQNYQMQPQQATFLMRLENADHALPYQIPRKPNQNEYHGFNIDQIN
jgi:hypothetical protein